MGRRPANGKCSSRSFAVVKQVGQGGDLCPSRTLKAASLRSRHPVIRPWGRFARACPDKTSHRQRPSLPPTTGPEDNREGHQMGRGAVEHSQNPRLPAWRNPEAGPTRRRGTPAQALRPQAEPRQAGQRPKADPPAGHHPGRVRRGQPFLTRLTARSTAPIM